MNTPPEIKKVTPQLYLFTALGMIAVFWAWWLLEHFTDYRIVRIGSTAHKEPLSYWLPLIGTPIILVGAFGWWRRAVGIVANGVLVDATIKKLGIGDSGMRDVTLAYSLSGRSYSIKKSIGVSDLGNRQVGETLQLVVDKRNPKRCIVNS